VADGGNDRTPSMRGLRRPVMAAGACCSMRDDHQRASSFRGRASRTAMREWKKLAGRGGGYDEVLTYYACGGLGVGLPATIESTVSADRQRRGTLAAIESQGTSIVHAGPDAGS